MTAARSRAAAVVGSARWLLWPCAIALGLPLMPRLWPAAPPGMAWALDLAAHWQWLYAVCWVALCLLLACARGWRWLGWLPLALLPLATASRALPPADAGAPVLVVAAANVYAGNHDPAPLVAWLRAHPADVVMLTELSPAYARVLVDALGGQYPHRALAPLDSPLGIGLIARRPLSQVALRRDADGIPHLAARLDTAAGPVRVIAAHPMPPMTVRWHHLRDTLLRTLAADADADALPTIVAGDLNATPWSSALIAAMDTPGGAGLRRAGGLAPTWPSAGRGIAGIPIDHVLASRHWRRGTATRGPDIGSDHLPVRVALARATPAAD